VAESLHLLRSYDIDALLDEVAGADPPAYLRRCLAEGIAAPRLTWVRVQQLAACAILIDAVAASHDYDFLEHELIADWREHHAADFRGLKSLAARALQAALRQAASVADADAMTELRNLEQRLAAAG
jgi:hypothetical protein